MLRLLFLASLFGPVFGLVAEPISLRERALKPVRPTCGGIKGNTCNPTNAAGGPCCGANGKCGAGPKYCGAGCQWSFSNPGCSSAPDNTCGGAAGYSCDPNSLTGGACCSASGKCGYDSTACGTGCQSAFGQCFGSSPAAINRGGKYYVPKVGTFNTHKTYTFAQNGVLPAGLVAWDGPQDPLPNASVPYQHKFIKENVDVRNGFLRLKVPGGQTVAPYKAYTGAEVVTAEKNIHFASVRTFAIFSKVPGTVHGNFFYGGDLQEIDIEYLTDPNSQSVINKNLDMQYVIHNREKDFERRPRIADCASVVHEYRIDWIRGKALFYLDGVLQLTFTKNIPRDVGPWIWNNWSSGSPGFTVGPPTQDNFFRIQKIVMYYNTTRHV